MTKTEAKLIVERFELVKALAEGKQIQCFIEEADNWENISNPDLLYDGLCIRNYRIKPEEKYVPFTKNDNLIGKIIFSPNSIDTHNKRYLIINQDDNGIDYMGLNERISVTYNSLMNWKFSNEDFCAKKVEE